MRAMTQYSRNLIRLTCLPLCHSLLQTAGNLISQFFRNAIFSYFFLTSAFHFLEAEVRKDSHSLYSRHSRHNRHSLLKTAGNITRCINKTKTKSAMLPTSLMSFFLNFFRPGVLTRSMRQRTNDASDVSLPSPGYVARRGAPGPPMATCPHCLRQILLAALAAHIDKKH